ncbi:aminotransferase class I/II-fold pyridoxal phosphate-dependent enzyme [Dongia rigui]|uniref:Aminotransferase class I/II-fold pyridoxal phosphate-dependent enzyme n=1 Tax=Dongia rigui TaxID=940149 RepID=A0ABU5E1R8_9PROT|nr:aminotransferase class I/II-fold pyridoxal phosphate-dependent enzyme [Dongia rigui]MDY0873490.1 aminotransferase class I/II-fold pyridoxal phosphate-dependent enzyme [Dongia rigui]
MNQDRVESLAQFHPFTRLNKLLEGTQPGGGNTPLLLSLGEPQFQPPAFATDAIANAKELWSKYPPTIGNVEFRAAAKAWLVRRYGIEPGFIDADRMIVPVSGTREALFHIALSAVAAGLPKGKAKVLMANPFYHTYAGAAVVAGGEPAFLPAGPETAFLPDPEAVPVSLLQEAAMVYLCSPANPQGSVADAAFWRRWIELARRHDFVIAADECYAEIYTGAPPAGAIEAAQASGSCDNVLVFHSLSKRSSAPGMRSGFVAGDARFISRQAQLINYGGVAVPLPILAASTLLWSDEAHVTENRQRYQASFDLAQKALGPIFGNVKPGGGFFLWLDVGDGEKAAVELWRQAAIKVLPGGYMARVDANGRNPGAPFIRVALVYEPQQLAGALERMAGVLGSFMAAGAEMKMSSGGQ